MKTGIHPEYNSKVKAKCACGATYDIGSTQEIDTEVCSACHPFYTGKQKIMDTAGRVDRFKQKMAAAEARKKKVVTEDEDELVENAEQKAEVVETKPVAKKKAAKKN